MNTLDNFHQTADSSPLELGTRILESKAWVVFRQDDDQAHLHMSDESAMLLIGDLFIAYPQIEARVREYVRGSLTGKT
ncbi:MAG TPA: hypothetical protein VF629_21335 [Hymenobacter sp.]|jgi:hypothetical protein|uniref:hypothetical protein n=1 Tax=Hymenobacter sp. TaxID=1898978 RepID=UPI002ED86660